MNSSVYKGIIVLNVSVFVPLLKFDLIWVVNRLMKNLQHNTMDEYKELRFCTGPSKV